MAFGLFAPHLIDCMEYPSEVYANLRAETPVCITLREAYGEEDVAALAGALGIDPLDFARHHLDPNKIDGTVLEEPARLDKLREAGFSFHFVPVIP